VRERSERREGREPEKQQERATRSKIYQENYKEEQKEKHWSLLFAHVDVRGGRSFRARRRARRERTGKTTRKSDKKTKITKRELKRGTERRTRVAPFCARRRARRSLLSRTSTCAKGENGKNKTNPNNPKTKNIRSYGHISPNIRHRSTTIYSNPTSTNGKTKNEALKTYYKITIPPTSSKQHRLKRKMGNTIINLFSNIKTITLLEKCLFRTKTSRSTNHCCLWASHMGTRGSQLPNICTYCSNNKRFTRTKQSTPRIPTAYSHAQCFGSRYALALNINKNTTTMRHIKHKHSRHNLGSQVWTTKRIKVCMQLRREIRIKSKISNAPMEQSRTNKSNKTTSTNKHLPALQQHICIHKASQESCTDHMRTKTKPNNHCSTPKSSRRQQTKSQHQTEEIQDTDRPNTRETTHNHVKLQRVIQIQTTSNANKNDNRTKTEQSQLAARSKHRKGRYAFQPSRGISHSKPSKQSHSHKRKQQQTHTLHVFSPIKPQQETQLRTNIETASSSSTSIALIQQQCIENTTKQDTNPKQTRKRLTTKTKPSKQ
jgi:hypothetical protein